MGWPGVTSNPLTIFPNLAYMAFPILPYELFMWMPVVIAYYAEKPTEKVTLPRLITFTTYFGGLYGGLVHYVALLSVLSGIPHLDKDHGICTALPPPTDGPWCELLTAHILLVNPMGTYFLYVMYIDKKKYGWLSWAGDDEKVALFWRAGLVFTILGISGELPYFGQLEKVGGDTFDGTGVYAGTTWADWYEGRGYIEFISYLSWLSFGLYFLAKAAYHKRRAVHVVNEKNPDTDFNM